MCYPLPGPRCSNHTMKAYLSKRRAVEQAESKVNEANKQYYFAQENPESTTHQVNEAAFALEKSLEKLRAAQEERLAALKDWYSSPDGIEYLEAKSADAGSDEEAQKWDELLHEARETRRYQAQSMELVRATQRGLNSLYPEESQKLLAKQEEGKQAAKAVEDLNPKILEANRTFKERSQQAQDAEAYVQSTQAAAKRHRDALARLVRDEYVRNGVDSRMANHYALDTVNSMQEGWHYLADDSSRRVPNWGQNITIKTKGEGDKATNATRASLQQSEAFKEALDVVRIKHEEAAAAIPVAQQALLAQKESRVELDNILAERESLTQRVDAIRLEYDKMRAGYGNGTQRGEHYDVGYTHFVRSSYVNPDGSTNAFVFSRELNKKVPVFVPVESTGKDSGGFFITTSAGQKMYSADMKKAEFRLVRPQSGARSIRQVSNES